MKTIRFLILLLVAFSCQIEDDSAPAPDESFIKFYGVLTSYEARDIEFLQDSVGFAIFADAIDPSNGSSNFSLWRVNSDGLLIDSKIISLNIPLGVDLDGDMEEDILVGNSEASQVEVFENGFAIVGTTELNDNQAGIFNVNVANVDILDLDLESVLDTIITFSAGRPTEGLDLFGADIIRTQDQNFLFVGSREIQRETGETDFDYQVVKFGTNTSTGRVIEFSKIINVSGDGNDDFAVRIFEKSNRNIVIIGYTEDRSDFGENAGNTGLNVTFTELDSEGDILDNKSYGIHSYIENDMTVYNEIVNDAILTPSGFAISGTSVLSTEVSYAFYMNLTQNGGFIGGDTLGSTFGSGIETEGRGIVQTISNDFVILGSYSSLSVDGQPRLGEAMFMGVDPVGLPISGYETNYGTVDGNDSAVDGLLLPDRKIVVLANIDFGGGVKLLSVIKTDDNGQLEN